MVMTNQIANGSNCTHMLSPFIASLHSNWSLGKASQEEAKRLLARLE